MGNYFLCLEKLGLEYTFERQIELIKKQPVCQPSSNLRRF
jgi:hypothetical protein